MVTKTMNICGKEVTLCYCFATEINYTNLTDGDNANIFIPDAAKKIDALSKGGTEMPDIKKCICLIIAAALAYYSSKDEETPLIDKDLLFCENPKEIYEALTYVILLYSQFYHLIPSEAELAEKEKEGNKGKN